MAKIDVKKRVRINERIRAEKVRLINSEGEQLGVVSISDAIAKAKEVGMDLIQISKSNQISPIVCKIMDYGKFLFEQKKQTKTQKHKKIQIKEVKFRPGIDEGDYHVKLRNLMRFIEEGYKGKVTLRFRGREMMHQELGQKLMERIESDLGDLVVVESRPQMEGHQMIMMLSPKKRK